MINLVKNVLNINVEINKDFYFNFIGDKLRYI